MEKQQRIKLLKLRKVDALEDHIAFKFSSKIKW